jgi:hypothetical protein
MRLLDIMKNLFDLQKTLYGAGARNFLFIDVPPMDRSPAGNYAQLCLQWIVYTADM